MKYISAGLITSGSHLCKQRFFFSLILVSLIVTACSSFNGTPFEKYLGADTNLITFSYTIADNLVQRANPPLRSITLSTPRAKPRAGVSGPPSWEISLSYLPPARTVL